MAKFQPKPGDIVYVAELEKLNIKRARILDKKISADGKGGIYISYRLIEAAGHSNDCFDIHEARNDVSMTPTLALAARALVIHTKRCGQDWIQSQLKKIQGCVDRIDNEIQEANKLQASRDARLQKLDLTSENE